MHNYYTYNTTIGEITIAADGEEVTMLRRGRITLAQGEHKDEPSALTDMAALQLEEYLKGKRREFDLPLHPHGTAFQCAVWDELKKIPYGETRSYKQIADALGRPNAYRAVGMANNKNPIWIIIPCHRVIGTDGSLTGYGGGLDMKEKLLRLEAGAV